MVAELCADQDTFSISFLTCMQYARMGTGMHANIIQLLDTVHCGSIQMLHGLARDLIHLVLECCMWCTVNNENRCNNHLSNNKHAD